MFVPPRFVVVDDREEHLKAIVRAMTALGMACLPVHFEAGAPLNSASFMGVRCLFLDLQLLSDAKTTNYAPHFASIQTILEDNISETGGPFVLVLWTSHADQADKLTEYLLTHLDQAKPWASPLAVFALPKTDYIVMETGEPRDIASLVTAISEKVDSTPALATFLGWELDVLAAVAQVLNDLVGLAGTKRTATLTERGTALANLMKRLAVQTVGSINVDKDPRAALHSALLPLLNDRLQNLPTPPTIAWQAAFDSAERPLPVLTTRDAADLNTRLHLDFRPVPFSEWGAVSDIPSSFDWGAMGLADADALKKEMKISGFVPPLDVASATPVRIRIGAACDYAQLTVGPIPMALGVLISAKDDGSPRQANDRSHCWVSPTLAIGASTRQLVVHPRFTFAAEASRARGVSSFRIREQLLLELIGRISTYEARPGITNFGGGG